MPTWPISLPQAPEIPGYEEQEPNAVVMTQMDAGPPKSRQRFTAAYAKVTFTFMLTSADVATFRTFYRTTLGYGALAFDFTIPRVGGTGSYKFRGQPTYVPLGPATWRVTCPLWQLP